MHYLPLFEGAYTAFTTEERPSHALPPPLDFTPDDHAHDFLVSVLHPDFLSTPPAQHPRRNGPYPVDLP